MFNYPVKIEKNKLVSPKKLYIVNNFRYQIKNEVLKNKKYFYDFCIREYSFSKQKDKLWFLLHVSKDNFEPSLDWIDFPKDNLILKILDKSSNFFTQTQKDLIVDYITDRPEEDYIDYVESIFLTSGIGGALSNITSLELMSVEAIRSGLFKNKKIINEYNFEDIEKWAYHVDSLFPKFLIRTNNFNQCFFYKNEYYSSVAVIKREEKYAIYIYGCDDSSYTKYVDSLEEAEIEVLILKTLSKCINGQHIDALKYEFTN